MLVEDHAAFRQALAFLLGRQPDLMVVAQAGSLAEGRDLLGMPDGFDVAVVALGLPDGDGEDLIRELRGVKPRVSILALTMSLDHRKHARAREAGAGKVLGKESALGEVLGAIRRLGDGAARVSLSSTARNVVPAAVSTMPRAKKAS